MVRASALKSGVLAEDIEDVMVLTSPHFDLDDEGNVMVLGADGKASATSLDDFFGKSFKEQKPKFYAPTGGSGSGAPPSGGGGTGAPNSTSSTSRAG